ncbi:MAG: WD40/YVTN/BNR-like repeat-containing protein [Bryobacteraceae bacterium]
MRCVSFVLLSQIMLVGPGPLGAGWRELEPLFGGRVDRIAIDAGGALWAVTPGAVFRSADNAANWASAVGNLPATSITAITVDPAVVGIVYPATTQGCYRTADTGVTRSQHLLTLPGGIRIQELAVAPSNRDAIHAATFWYYLVKP